MMTDPISKKSVYFLIKILCRFELTDEKYVSNMIQFDLIGLRNLACIQTRYILSCLLRFTCNLRSTKLSSSTNPESVNSFRSSSIGPNE